MAIEQAAGGAGDAGAGAAGAAEKAASGVSGVDKPAAGAGQGGGTPGAGAEGGAGGGDPGAGDAGYWPEGWKDRIVSKNDKAKQWIARYGSPDAAILAGFEAQQKIRTGQYKMDLPADAAPEEVAQWRKERGVPDSADGYKLDELLPADLKIPEAQRKAVEATVASFTPAFHQLGLPPKQASELVSHFLKHEDSIVAAQAEIARNATVERKAEVRAEYGKDYDRNVRVMNQFLDEHAGGEEGRKAIADMVLHDGTRLGDHPKFVRTMVQAGLANSDDATLARAAIDLGGKTPDQALNEAIDRKAPDDELLRLSQIVADHEKRSKPRAA